MTRSWSALFGAIVVVCACDAPPATGRASAPPTPIVSAAPPVERQVPESPRAPSAPTVRRYDLAADERKGGHTLARHVGRTDEQLRERLRQEPNISAASTYTDRETAELVVARAMDESASRLSEWQTRSGRRPNLVLDRDEPAPIGRSLRRGQRQPSDCAHAVVVLRWDDRAASKYVLTSYPECRR